MSINKTQKCHNWNGDGSFFGRKARQNEANFGWKWLVLTFLNDWKIDNKK